MERPAAAHSVHHPSRRRFFTPFGMQNESLKNGLIESTGLPQIELDPNLVQGDDMASESHPFQANLMQSYQDAMKEYTLAARGAEPAGGDARLQQGQRGFDGEGTLGRSWRLPAVE